MCMTRNVDEFRSLRSLPFHSQLTHHQRVRLRSIGTVVDVPAGTELVTEGNLGRESFVVIAGEARVSRNGTSIAELGAGDVFGELAVLARRRRNASVTALTAMTLLVLTPGELVELMDDVPPFAKQVWGTYETRSQRKRPHGLRKAG